MAIMVRCDEPGCFKLTGSIARNCEKCWESGYINREDATPDVIPAPELNRSKLHDWRCYLPETEPALNLPRMSRLWICHKCGDVSDQIVPSIMGCDVHGEDVDPTDILKAMNTAEV